MAETPDHLEQPFDGLTVRIDRTRCIGSGNCVKLAGQVFELDDSVLVCFVDPVGDVGREALTDACAACPVDALTVLTREGEQIVP